LEGLLERLGGSKEDRFPNLELLETDDETVYFDARRAVDSCGLPPPGVPRVDAGDKRDRETADR
jgi:hypothetical protein